MSNLGTSLMFLKFLLSTTAMVPFPFSADGHSDNYCMIEQVGLDVVDADTREDVEEI